MKKIILKSRVGLFIVMAFILSGCFGTINTRMWGCPVGSYPYKAVGVDAICFYMLMTSSYNLKEEWIVFPIVIISTPVDIVIDTVLLPIDLVFWPLGYKKSEPNFK